MTKQDLKHIIISIIVGASVAFFSSLFEGILVLLKSHGNDIIGGTVSSITYLIAKRHG